MIIDDTYFIRKLNLPQVGNSNGLAEVNQFIEIYEPEYLQKALGYNLWKAFDEALEGIGSGSGSGDLETRWERLLAGAEYSWNSKTHKWEGFENDLKKSPIANYVYYHYLQNDATTTVPVGQVKNKSDNADQVSPVFKMTDAWNRMVDMTENLQRFLTASKADYPERGSSYRYRFETFHKKNQLGL